MLRFLAVAALAIAALAAVAWLWRRVASGRAASPVGVGGAEATVRRLEAELQEARRLETLGLLSGGIAHDFNNLLTVILGNARLALAELTEGHPLRQRLARIEAAAEHGAALTEQMVIYSGRGSSVRKPADLSRLVDGLSELVRAAVPSRIDLRSSLDAPAWSEVDETQIRQVVLDLVAHAGEMLRDDAGRVEIRSGTTRVGAGAVVRGKDGAELAPGEYAFVAVTATRTGTRLDAAGAEDDPALRPARRGAGLTAVLEIVREHGGTVQVEEGGAGARTLRILLPGAGRPLVDSAQIADAPGRAGSARSERVLLIDEEPGVLEVGAELLERAGFEVTVAATGREGLALFREAPGTFAAAVVDLTMRDLSGETVAAELRALRPDLPVALASGLSAELAAYRTLELGAARFLRKPYAPDELAQAVVEMLSERPRRPLASRPLAPSL
jgi:two-component system, cell cycle sensor histidine kinase and response regulator CckA